MTEPTPQPKQSSSTLDYRTPPIDEPNAFATAGIGCTGLLSLVLGAVFFTVTIAESVLMLSNWTIFWRHHDFAEWFVPFGLAMLFISFGIVWVRRADKRNRDEAPPPDGNDS